MSEAVLSTEEKTANDEKSVLGFWIYLMTDCLLFASLFAAFVVLRGNTFGGPSGSDIFSLPFVLTETLILLTSSFACGLGILAARSGKEKQALVAFGLTFILGVAFLALELKEFSHLINEGHSWQQSAFLSAFFTLVGTHGLHITIGLCWLLGLFSQVIRLGTSGSLKRLTLFSLFWHFLDVIWIFIFTVAYLMGVG